MKRIITLVSVAALLGAAFVAVPAQAVLRVPKASWGPCSAFRLNYCIDSVMVTAPGGTPIALTYVPTGSASTVTAAPIGTATASPSPTATPAPIVTPTPTATTAPTASPTPTTAPTVVPPPAVIAEQGIALVGRWTSPDWAVAGFAAQGYDGLFIDAKTANEFVNHVFLDVRPAIVDSANKTYLAGLVGNKIYATPLDPDVVISVKLRSGEIKTGVTVAIANDVTVDSVPDPAGLNSTITITGTPVPVAMAASSKDCTGEAGKALANTRQFQVIVMVQNDTTGFGVEGVSGDMYVASNGVCGLSTPTWNPQNKEMTWQVASPHFASDGITVNRGFYKAVIPVADAALLWGLTNPNDAATALEVSISTESGGSTAVLKNIAVKGGKIIIDASGFTYSKPMLSIKIRKGYKASPTKFVAKKITINCGKGKLIKKVTATKPTCPTGYKKK